MTIVLLQISLHKRNELSTWLAFFFSLSLDPMRCHWTSTWRWSVLWIFSGVTLNLDSNSWTLVQSSNVNPGKILHSNSIGSPSILSKALYSGELLNHVNPSSHECWTLGSSSSFQGVTQNLKIRRPLCARDWWFLHHQPKINTSMLSVLN